MSQESWSREEVVVRVAIALKGLKEFKDKDLYELIDLACNLILFCRDQLPVMEQNFELKKQEAIEESKKIIPHAEVAKIVTGQSGQTIALQRFNRFYKALPDLIDKNDAFYSEWAMAHLTIKNGMEKGYRKKSCEGLATLYLRWWKFEQGRLQSERASNPRKKS